MAKIVYALLSVFVIEILLAIFAGATTSSTSLYGLITNPTNSNLLWAAILVALGTGAAAIIASSYFQINTYAIYAGVAAGAFTFGTILFNLYTFLSGELSGMGFSASGLVSAIVVAPLIIFYAITLFEFARSST